MDWSPVDKADVIINGKAYALARTQESMGYRRTRQRVDELPDELVREFKTGHGGYGTGIDIDLDTYAWADGMIAVDPNQVRIATHKTSIDAVPTPFYASTTNKHWAIENGERIQRWNPTDGTKEATTTVGSAVHTAAVAFNGKLFVASGSSVILRSLDEASAVTTYTGINREFLVVGRDKLWGSVPASHQIYSLRSADNPATVGTGGWSGPFPVGDPGSKITGMYMVDRYLVVAKEDGVYAVDDNGDFRVILPELREVVSPYNGRQGCVWFGGVLTPQDFGLVYFEEGIDPIQVGPEVIPYNDTPVRGTPVATCSAGKGIYMLVLKDTTPSAVTDCWLLYGRLPEQTDNPTTDIIWHPIHKHSLTLTATMPDKRFGMTWKRIKDSATLSPYQVIYTVPTDASTGAQYRYRTNKLGVPMGTHIGTGQSETGTIYMPGVDYKTQRTKKLRKIEVDSDSVQIKAEVSTNVGSVGWDLATWYSFGTKSEANPVFEHPAYDTNPGGEGSRLWTRFTLTQPSSGATPTDPLQAFGPRIYRVRLFAEPRVEVMQYLEIDLMLAKAVRTAKGVEVGRTPQAQLDELYRLIDSDSKGALPRGVGENQFELRDPAGAKWQARLVELQEQGLVSVPSVGPAVVATGRFQLIKRLS